MTVIVIKTSEQLAAMRTAGRITAEALAVAREAIRPGISTLEVDRRVRRYIEKCGATPSFLGYGGFPGACCLSLNDEVVHGIPSAHRIIAEGDLVKVDVGARYRGYHGDSARTYPVGQVTEEALRLISVTRQSFYEALRVMRHGSRVGDIGHAVESYVVGNGFSVVRTYVGHGVGAELHEEPEVPNFGTAGHGPRLYAGMTLAVEPMVNAGTAEVRVQGDGWTATTRDGALSAHYENSVAITDGDPELLTVLRDDIDA